MNRHREWDVEELRCLIGEGHTYDAIATRLGTCRQNVMRLRDKYGITRPKQKTPQGGRRSVLAPYADDIKAMRVQGWSDATIAGVLNEGCAGLNTTGSKVFEFRRWNGICVTRHGDNPERNKRAKNKNAAYANDLTKFRAKLGPAEEAWVDQLDDRMFDKAEGGRGRIDEVDPCDNGPANLPAMERGFGGSQMGWAA